jgi:hypothetical protein
MDNALKNLTIVVEGTPSDKIAYIDKECLAAVKLALQSVSNGHSPGSKESLDLSGFEKAIVIFTKLLNTQIDIEKQISSTTSAMRMH